MIKLCHIGELELFTSDKTDVVHGFSTRLGGVSGGAYKSLNLGVRTDDSQENVSENYKRLKNALGTHSLVLAKQEHTDCVLAVGREHIGTGELLENPFPFGVDGLVSDVPGIALGVFTADCTPVLLYDPKREAVGAVHSGWRGTTQHITKKAIDLMMEKYGCDPKDIKVLIGPSIKECCFEIKSDAEKILREAYPKLDFIKIRDGRMFADTTSCIESDLYALGITDIDICPTCTCCRNDLLFSHRKGDKGRQLGVIVNKKIKS